MKKPAKLNCEIENHFESFAYCPPISTWVSISRTPTVSIFFPSEDTTEILHFFLQIKGLLNILFVQERISLFDKYRDSFAGFVFFNFSIHKSEEIQEVHIKFKTENRDEGNNIYDGFKNKNRDCCCKTKSSNLAKVRYNIRGRKYYSHNGILKVLMQ